MALKRSSAAVRGGFVGGVEGGEWLIVVDVAQFALDLWV